MTDDAAHADIRRKAIASIGVGIVGALGVILGSFAVLAGNADVGALEVALLAGFVAFSGVGWGTVLIFDAYAALDFECHPWLEADDPATIVSEGGDDE